MRPDPNEGLLVSETRNAAGLSSLAPQLTGDALVPGDDGWDAARQAWNLAGRPAPGRRGARAEAPTTLRATVRFARENGLRVAPQATGHAALGIDSLEDTILLRTMPHGRRGGRSRPPAGRACEAGAIWGDVAARPASTAWLASAGSAARRGRGRATRSAAASAGSAACTGWPPTACSRGGGHGRRRAGAGRPRQRARPVLGAARRRRQLRRGDRARVLALPADRGVRRDDRLAGRARRRGDPRPTSSGVQSSRTR